MTNIASGQEVQWLVKMKSDFTNAIDLISAGLEIIPWTDWQKGTEPAAEEIALTTADWNIEYHNYVVTIPPEQREKWKNKEPDFMANATKGFVYNAQESFVQNYFNKVFAGIDFDGELALTNNVPWDHTTKPKSEAEKKNIVGLNMDQVNQASYLLNTQARTVKQNFKTGENVQVLVAPDVLYQSFVKSEDFRFDVSGLQGARLSNNFVPPSNPIVFRFLPTEYFVEAGLVNADIDRHGDKGIYAFLYNIKNTKGISSVGAETILSGVPFIDYVENWHHNGDMAAFHIWADGAMKCYDQTFIRIACRLENTHDL